ncbi:mechanosensitive ion channel family protein [Cupriavidus taiwanensis]|uniref:Small-conductance mechanosensitive channel n=1 Tax=Cupriavidus taiwanensis TaxID=164546 RepID=A0A375ILS6_9BURK|nr:mechanosensitive ion channel family protein [Cupriavidus taiwanensis]SOZ31755.1 Mechanosensitive (MS) channel [Cupriavidus taiwanensis]SPA36497.1 Mechanosensitive (MS) channel [Cupriavidus taiwanensis]SPK75011.1 Mechanosensitive (MS) channel [Cupriavidus taiwanensis]
MDASTFDNLKTLVVSYATEFGVKILAALAFWVIGRWLIHFVVRLVQNALGKQKVDPTLLRYVGSIVTVTLNVVLVIGILGYFGIQTTTFAALIAAAGVAIGMAWSGLMANFAAGAFLVVLRPFKVGDFVTIGGVAGTVREIGLFATTLDTPDNVQTVIGNNKIFSDTIQNFTANAFRRVELKAQLAASTDVADAVALLKSRIAEIPNVLAEPPVDVEILEFTLVGPVLAVRPYCHNDHYWQVYFDTNRVIRECFGQAGYAAPMPAHMVVVQQAGVPHAGAEQAAAQQAA